MSFKYTNLFSQTCKHLSFFRQNFSISLVQTDSYVCQKQVYHTHAAFKEIKELLNKNQLLNQSSLKTLCHARTLISTVPFKEIYASSEKSSFFTAYIILDNRRYFNYHSIWELQVGSKLLLGGFAQWEKKRREEKNSVSPRISVWALDINLLSCSFLTVRILKIVRPWSFF